MMHTDMQTETLELALRLEATLAARARTDARVARLRALACALRHEIATLEHGPQLAQLRPEVADGVARRCA